MHELRISAKSITGNIHLLHWTTYSTAAGDVSATRRSRGRDRTLLKRLHAKFFVQYQIPFIMQYPTSLVWFKMQW
ncbi:hypothetical protein O6P43_021466 [Quillaja saponaria]|uniref:Uncharacterized protein n=1 Tax=Quillaja saponaria TaxID=32244 RepID=A0AAD7PH05_QUISA|nr:hypothetical protein O6P43_021466 [Quillaja saponaria]